MPDAPDPASRTRAQAAYVLRMHALARLSDALGGRGLDVLVVKGAALAMTHYAEPWSRSMCDVDLVVRTGARGRVLAALAAQGFAVQSDAEHPLSSDFFGETCLTLACGAMQVAFELHTRLDKLVARPVDYDAIFARASQAPSLPHLLVPSAEDHVLLVSLHASAHDFFHPPARADLELLLARGVDEAALLDRAKRWRLRTALFVMLSLLRDGGSTRVPDRLLDALAPRAIRRAMVDLYVSRVTAPGAAQRLGWPWIASQTLLRDDLSAWARGVLTYAGVRAAERAFFDLPDARRRTDCAETSRTAR